MRLQKIKTIRNISLLLYILSILIAIIVIYMSCISSMQLTAKGKLIISGLILFSALFFYFWRRTARRLIEQPTANTDLNVSITTNEDSNFVKENTPGRTPGLSIGYKRYAIYGLITLSSLFICSMFIKNMPLFITVIFSILIVIPVFMVTFYISIIRKSQTLVALKAEGIISWFKNLRGLTALLTFIVCMPFALSIITSYYWGAAEWFSLVIEIPIFYIIVLAIRRLCEKEFHCWAIHYASIPLAQALSTIAIVAVYYFCNTYFPGPTHNGTLIQYIENFSLVIRDSPYVTSDVLRFLTIFHGGKDYLFRGMQLDFPVLISIIITLGAAGIFYSFSVFLSFIFIPFNELKRIILPLSYTEIDNLQSHSINKTPIIVGTLSIVTLLCLSFIFEDNKYKIIINNGYNYVMNIIKESYDTQMRMDNATITYCETLIKEGQPQERNTRFDIIKPELLIKYEKAMNFKNKNTYEVCKDYLNWRYNSR